jgi:uncharacterized MAPEG superfamily protein
MVLLILLVLALFVIQTLLPACFGYLGAGRSFMAALGPRDDPPPQTRVGGRAERALANMQEALPVFLALALVPTEFSQKWMSIEPAAARIARLSPFVLPVDGIVPVGTCEWLDMDTHDKLMLVYLDRPARIRGEIVYEGRSLRFDIESKEAGYIWIRQPEGSGEYRLAPWPGRVILAVMPN